MENKESLNKAFIVAWILGCLFYLLEYAVRSSPAVMLVELSEHFKIKNLRLASVLGTYYYTYAITSLIAGIALDRFGGKYAIAVGCLVLGAGCLIFSIQDVAAGDVGRLMQGAGSAFAFTGCVYLAAHGFQAKYIATAIGFTQCMGMLGGSGGQFIIGPLIHSGLGIKEFWIVMGLMCGVIGVLLFIVTPKDIQKSANNFNAPSILSPYKIVFTNPQSYLSGIISGLLFAPTTIFAMTWGVAFFQQDRNISYPDAVLICAMVPMGWVIGCPLLGWISDSLGKRKTVLLVAVLIMFLIYAQLLFFPGIMPQALSMLIFGIASGAAMIPYSIIKEANPDQVKGSATGAQNFITFSITAMLAPLFAGMFGRTLSSTVNHDFHFQNAGIFFLITTALAFLLSLVIKETGSSIGKKLDQ